jgi:hypothetical protein
MKISCVLVFAFLVVTTFAWSQEDKKRIKEQAESVAKSLLEDDYETLLKFTYPKIIELSGGPDALIELIKNGKAEMSQQGVTFDKVMIGEPSQTVKAGDEIHGIVPQTVYMKVPTGIIENESYLLAISRDDGNHWYFIDGANLTPQSISTLLPNYNPALVVPSKTQPRLIRK